MSSDTQYALNESDIKKYFPSAKIMTYNDIEKYNNIHELLGRNSAIFILIETTRPFTGHWLLVFKNGNNIQFFDSYGFMIETQKKFIKSGSSLLNRRNHLSILFKNCPYDIHYNQFKLQGPNSNTCGRWCILRLKKRKLSEEEFKNFIVAECEKNDMTPDEYVANKIKV